MRATARDALGNSKVSAGTPLVISHKRLVTKTFKKTIPATRTLANQYVGKCSTLAKNVRGWSGSIGLYTNTKCDGNFRASVVVAVHALRMPRAERYGRFQITTYGGAAKTRPGSYLFFDMRKNNGDWGTNDTRLGYTVGGHAGPERAGSDYVWADRYVVWSVYTALGARYDVKTFTIRMKYDVLM